MYLKKIEIAGFKSFAQKTTLDFLPASMATVGDVDGTRIAKNSQTQCGVTVIVGPNGSGKSNISDAMRWVMGEQSMKNLRGKRSEDIVFSGSDQKARMNMASVTMHFDNHDKRIPLSYDDVSITRKIYRNGEGTYFVNGSRVRLMDVVDLLAKAGLGKESYCLVNQGMTDATLEANPQERRIMIEDAAGVKQYQIKKERALRKMEKTQENISRTADLTAELEPHVQTLKRQAKKAQKGKEILLRLKEKQQILYSYLWDVYQKERNSAQKQKDQIGIDMKNQERAVDRIADHIAEISKQSEENATLQSVEDERQKIIAELNEREKDLVVTEGRLEVAKERRFYDTKLRSIPVDLPYVQKHLQDVQGEQQQLVEKLDAASDVQDLVALRVASRSITEKITALLLSVAGRTVSVPQNDEKILTHDTRIRQLTERAGEIRSTIEKLRAKDTEKMERILAERIKERETRKQFFVLEKDLQGSQQKLEDFKDQFNEAKIRIARVEVREEDLVGQVREELNTTVDSLSFNGIPVNQEELEREILKLRSQHEQIGGIDPMVMEEYEEMQKRYDFLTKESKDLEKAVRSLKEIIKEMDQKIDNEFSRAYKHINMEFAKYFRMIFSGGTARLTKVKIPRKNENGEEDQEGREGAEQSEVYHGEFKETQGEVAYDVGIEITACPPGKKINHLSLLSGGERSLTAIALLFAIIAHNPPPFAVLDEVEAALDEANSRRFGKIIQTLATHTQFVIITHNRETMRQASLLYGVTMGNDGASRILSVHLDQMEEKTGAIARTEEKSI